jgi:hypothetical protein
MNDAQQDALTQYKHNKLDGFNPFTGFDKTRMENEMLKIPFLKIFI